MTPAEIIERAIAQGMIPVEYDEITRIQYKISDAQIMRLNLARAKKFARIGKIARNAQGQRFTYIAVESLIGGEMLDMGRFIAFDAMRDDQGPDTYNMRIETQRDRILNASPESPEWVEGHYIESCGAIIRIWL